MTSEQIAQWQTAIPVLDYLDFLALSDEGLRDSNRRLAGLVVPAWASDLRTQLITAGWHLMEKELWVPEFALRSEVALVGLQIRHQNNTELERAYQRLFVRFTQEILHPFVGTVEQADRYRRAGYKSLVKLHQLCERFEKEGSAMRWPRRLESFPETVRGLFLEPFPAFAPRFVNREVYEVSFARSMTDELHRAITSVLNPGVPVRKDWNLASLLEALEWCESPVSKGRSKTDLIATAYLTALELQCPPPDWLPQSP